MKALTILQPYAHLVCLPESNPLHKRVENRTWSTSYRGPLAIHSGALLRGRDRYGFSDSDFSFRSIVAVADLVECLPLWPTLTPSKYNPIPEKLRWIVDHIHTAGPWCWILQDVRVLKHPITIRGFQRLWEVPAEIAAQIQEELHA